jgi:hypothetical protein
LGSIPLLPVRAFIFSTVTSVAIWPLPRYMSIGRTGLRSLRERPAATAMRIAWSPSRAVHGLAISPRATRRNVVSSSR